jgi:SP family general alpha glucoside:H+ symporter-like MFS transporter
MGRSFAELDLLFEKRVSARKFASTSVDVFEDSQTLEGTAVFDRYEEKEAVVAVRTESITAERKV